MEFHWCPRGGEERMSGGGIESNRCNYGRRGGGTQTSMHPGTEKKKSRRKKRRESQRPTHSAVDHEIVTPTLVLIFCSLSDSWNFRFSTESFSPKINWCSWFFFKNTNIVFQRVYPCRHQNEREDNSWCPTESLCIVSCTFRKLFQR